MCAERLPSECHRFLISDYLVATGETVSHLGDDGAMQDHRLDPVAWLRDGKLAYDGETQAQLKLEG